MYKIAVMGDWDSIYGFGALGLDTFRIEADESPEEAAQMLRRLARNNYEVIYITEALAAKPKITGAPGVSVPEPKLIVYGVTRTK